MNYNEHAGLAQALFEESRDAIFLLDTNADVILDANGSAQRLTGFSLRELIGAPVANMFRCDDEPGLRPLPQHVRQIHHQFAQRRYRLHCFHEPGWLPVDVTLTRIVVKPRSLLLVTVQNARITAAQRAWDIRQLRRLMGERAVCLWQAEIDRDGGIEFKYFTPVIKSLSGRPAKYFRKGLESWSEIIHSDDSPVWQASWKRIAGGKSSESEYRIHWPDKSIRWLRESVHAKCDEDTGNIALLGITSNITPLKNDNDPPVRQTASIGQG